MAEKKRFKSQTLDSRDYEKTEESAKLVKESGLLLLSAGTFIGLAKKYGPTIIKSATKIIKK